AAAGRFESPEPTYRGTDIIDAAPRPRPRRPAPGPFNMDLPLHLPKFEDETNKQNQRNLFSWSEKESKDDKDWRSVTEPLNKGDRVNTRILGHDDESESDHHAAIFGVGQDHHGTIGRQQAHQHPIDAHIDV
ncbi:unnamed protein product, partial [Amoebophrya sp. A25]